MPALAGSSVAVGSPSAAGRCWWEGWEQAVSWGWLLVVDLEWVAPGTNQGLGNISRC